MSTAALAAAGLALGLLVDWIGSPPLYARSIWGAALLPALIYLCAEVATKFRRANPGLDIVAAFAMAMALALGETLAGCVVALMYSGGQMLESFAQRRARREMSALVSQVPKFAARYSDGSVEDVPIEAVVPGDRLLIRTGEAVPADGTVASDLALLDLSKLTGESIPVRRRASEPVLGGSINLGAAFDLAVTRPPGESAIAAIVRLVEAAGSNKAPMVRLADRYGLWFLAATLMAAGLAWLVSNEPGRALAVLVVATPCPLILAVPVAIMSGVSHCARHGVLVKDGAALETLARIETVVIDKTGTLTEGRARLVRVERRGAFTEDEILRLAATLDLASSHVVATALVAAAGERGLSLGRPIDIQESPGLGIEGNVEGYRVAVGGANYIAKRLQNPLHVIEEQSGPLGHFAVSVAVDGDLVGQIVFTDQMRGDSAVSLERFRTAGVSRIVLASGDQHDIAVSIGTQLGIEQTHGALTPQGKVDIVTRERERGCVMMVGDGVNDAPALAAADLGVALGVRGAAASSEVADVVLLVDRMAALADAIEIARRARGIALQSANAGMALSLIAMVVAGLGHLPPVHGAILQEIIDIGVVLNALRALGGGPKHVAP